MVSKQIVLRDGMGRAVTALTDSDSLFTKADIIKFDRIHF